LEQNPPVATMTVCFLFPWDGRFANGLLYAQALPHP